MTMDSWWKYVHQLKTKMTKEETLFYSIEEQLEDAEKGQLFGKPCFKVNTKAIICFFRNEMVFKLTEITHTEALSLDKSQLFDASGEKWPMKEWVQVPFDYSENWTQYAQSAMKYVSGK